jgi:hypothetical protein
MLEEINDAKRFLADHGYYCYDLRTYNDYVESENELSLDDFLKKIIKREPNPHEKIFFMNIIFELSRRVLKITPEPELDWGHVREICGGKNK